MRLSFTALQDFKTCPLKFKFGQIDRIKTPKTPELVFGTLIHECLYLAYNPSRETPASEKEILQYFNKKWNPEIYKDEQTESSAFSSGIQVLKDFFAKNNPAQARILALEKSFAITAELKNKEYQITGKIDRVDKMPNDSVEIIDYKTSKKMPPQKYIDDNLQLSIYHAGLISLWPSIKNRAVKTSLYFLRHGEKLSTNKKAQDLKETEEDVKKAISDIITYKEKNKWEPIPGPLCDWCGFKHLCPMFRHKFSQAPLPDSEKIKEIADKLFEIKKEAKNLRRQELEIKQILDKYLEANQIERIFGSKGFITRSKSQFFSYDLGKLKEIFGDRLIDILKVDTVKLNKKIKDLSPTKKEILEKSKKLERESKTFNLTIK